MPSVMSWLTPLLATVGSIVVGYFVLRKDKFAKKVDSDIEKRKSDDSARQVSYDQVQEDLENARTEASKLRGEMAADRQQHAQQVEAARAETSKLWTQLQEVRQSMAQQMDDIRTEGEKRIRQLSDDHARQMLRMTRWNDALIEHINQRKGPPAPGQPEGP